MEPDNAGNFSVNLQGNGEAVPHWDSSLDLVVTRLGNTSNDAEEVFDARFWELLMAAAPKQQR